MKRPAMYAAIALALASAAACADNRDPAEIKSELEVTGCLTGVGDRFVLTELDRTNTGTTVASPATESYQLIGDASVLRPHVGKQVRVSGMAEAPEVTIVRESSPPAPAAQPGVGTAGEAGAQPKVSTEQQTRLEISSLRVRSVTPSGSSCTQ